MKVGDRVRIITKEFENNSCAPHYGICGTIISLHREAGNTAIVRLLVRREKVDPQDVYYHSNHLEVIPHEPLEPDFSLEEIELAERLLGCNLPS